MYRKYFFFVFPILIACLITPPTFSQTPGEVSMWEFNEGKGVTLTDNSKRMTAAIGTEVAPENEPVGSADSPSGKAGDRSVNIMGGLIVSDNDAPILNIGSGPITIEAWIKLDSLPDWSDIVRYGNSYKMGFSNTSNLLWTFLGIEDVQSDVVFEADQVWHHFATAWEPGKGVTFFLDGKQVDYKETTNTNRALQSYMMQIGTDAVGTSQLFGLLDRLRIHKAVLKEADLDSSAASPKAPLANTLVSYAFDETNPPYANSAAAKRPAESWNQWRNDKFSTNTPTGKAGDYSYFFDAFDRIMYTDDQDILQFADESFTVEAWIKCKAAYQVVDRSVLCGLGVGGASGYSFSFRHATTISTSSTDSPSGKAGDRSVRPNGGLMVDDSNSPILAIQDGPITAEAWIKLEALTTYTDIARYGNSYKFGFDNTGHLEWTFLGIEDVASDVTLTGDNTWHHIAMVWEPYVGVTFYLDGAQVDFKTTGNVGRDLQSNILNIGTNSSGGDALNGLVDRLRIHNAVLTQADLDSNAANPKAPLTSTIVAYNMDEDAPPYKNAASANRPALNRASGNALTVTSYGIIDAHSTNASFPDDGQWHHVAAVHDMGVEFRYYVDGKLMETMTYADGVRYAATNVFNIGSEAGGGNPYIGYMDRLKITRAALTEAKLDYFKPSTPVAHWSLY